MNVVNFRIFAPLFGCALPLLESWIRPCTVTFPSHNNHRGLDSYLTRPYPCTCVHYLYSASIVDRTLDTFITKYTLIPTYTFPCRLGNFLGMRRLTLEKYGVVHSYIAKTLCTQRISIVPKIYHNNSFPLRSS